VRSVSRLPSATPESVSPGSRVQLATIAQKRMFNPYKTVVGGFLCLNCCDAALCVAVRMRLRSRNDVTYTVAAIGASFSSSATVIYVYTENISSHKLSECLIISSRICRWDEAGAYYVWRTVFS
jgi:hypothetical protein